MRIFKPFIALLLAGGLAGCTSYGYGSYGYQEGYAYPSYDYGSPGYGYAYPSYGYYPGYSYGPDVGLGFSYYNYNYGPSYRGGYGNWHQGNWNNGNNGHWNGGSNGQGSGSPPPAGQPAMQRPPTLPPGAYANSGTHSTHGGAETYPARNPYPYCQNCRS
jgi:hypothetical protein